MTEKTFNISGTFCYKMLKAWNLSPEHRAILLLHASRVSLGEPAGKTKCPYTYTYLSKSPGIRGSGQGKKCVCPGNVKGRY